LNAALLPDPDPSDSSETRWALETARNLWGQGEQREALQWVRRAAEAAAESGQDDRALLLAKQGAELRTVLDIPKTLPPPPAEVSDGEMTAPPVSPRATLGSDAGLKMRAPDVRASSPGVVVQDPRAPSMAARPPAVAAAASKAPGAPAVFGSAHAIQPTARSVAPSVVPSSSRGAQASASERGDELLVTVVATDGSMPTSDASLVSRRAVRVAVIAVDSSNELRVRRLAPGEVAPEEATVALLVAFEPGAPPVPTS
jgi:hypothetical protein